MKCSREVMRHMRKGLWMVTAVAIIGVFPALAQDRAESDKSASQTEIAKSAGTWDSLVDVVDKGDFQAASDIVAANPALTKMTRNGISVLLFMAALVSGEESAKQKQEMLTFIRSLILSGADVNLKGCQPARSEDEDSGEYDGKTALLLAHDFEVVKLLLSNGADVNARDKYGSTKLHTAAFYGDIPLAQLLLTKGADINAKGQFDSTPLSDAVDEEKGDMMLFLIKNGANVHDGAYLHHAALKKNIKIAEILINAGVDVNERNPDGLTPLDWAWPPGESDPLCNKCNPEMAKFLRAHGGVR